MTAFGRGTELFVNELDTAIGAHLDWTRRVLRCALLQVSPGDDVLAADAHCRCRFGRWFTQQHEALEAIDAAATARARAEHEAMHDAVRVLCTAVLEGRPVSAEALAQFEATQSALVTELAALKTQILGQAARIDPLTALPLRYGIEVEFERAWARARRAGEVLVIVMVDIDHFKRVNDTFGHAAGDEAIRFVAQLLRGAARKGEAIFRFGGEEFLWLVQVEVPSAAETAVERMLQALRDQPCAVEGCSPLRLTASAGLCPAAPNDAMADVIARADRALYAAKVEGRDRWRWAASP